MSDTEPKVLLVKRPSDGKTYILFTATKITDGMIGIVVTAVVEPITIPGARLPFPLEIKGREMEAIVKECFDQIKEYAEELGRRYDEAHKPNR